MARKPTGGGETYAELRQRSRTVLGRQKLADGGPVFTANNWQAPSPNLPSFGIDSSPGRKGATDFRAGYGVGDVSASGNYQKATDGGRDSYGGRLTLHRSFAAGGAVKAKPKPLSPRTKTVVKSGKAAEREMRAQRKAAGGPVGLGQTPPWEMPITKPKPIPLIPAPKPISLDMPQPLSLPTIPTIQKSPDAWAAAQAAKAAWAAKATPAKRGGRQPTKGGRS